MRLSSLVLALSIHHANWHLMPQLFDFSHLSGWSAIHIRKAHSTDRRSHWGCGASTPSSIKRRRLDGRPCLVVLTRGASGQVDVSLRGWIQGDPFRSFRCDYVSLLFSDALSFRIYPPFLRRNQAAPLCALASSIISLAHLYLTHYPYLLRCLYHLSLRGRPATYTSYFRPHTGSLSHSLSALCSSSFHLCLPLCCKSRWSPIGLFTQTHCLPSLSE